MTSQNADAGISAITPEKVGGHGKPPAQVTSILNGDVLAAEDAGVPNAQQENHKPKRKYVRKQRTPAPEPATERPAEEEAEPEEETQPGGRRRRGAAKV